MTAVDDAKGVWAGNKTAIIAGLVGAFVFLILICCCYCKCRRMNKKKKKEAEKLRLRGAKPSKKLKRIQPGRVERKTMEELGFLKFMVRYDVMSEMLLVTVLEAEDVPVHDLSGYAYSYVRVRVLPLHEDEDSEFRSKVVRAGFWPAFGDVFPFVIPKDMLDEQVMYLYFYEMNRWSKQDGIGQIAVDLKDLSLLSGKEQNFRRKLKPYDPLIGLEIETGAIYMAISYDEEEWELEIEVRQGDIIPKEDGKEKGSSYVSIKALNKEGELIDRKRTSVMRGTLQPLYDDYLTFNIPDNLLPDLSMKISCKTPHYVKKNTLIGHTTLTPDSDHWKQLLEKGCTEGWFSIYRKPKPDTS